MKTCIQTIQKYLIAFAVLAASSAVVATDVIAQGNLLSAATPAEPEQKQQHGDDHCDKVSPVSTHKINYITVNNVGGKDNTQVKFQFSAKYKFLDKDFSVQGKPLSINFAYSQKSLWNVGQESMPFEENNYNPEGFLDYGLNLIQGPFSLRNIILGYEHESNGVAGPPSRSWNRAYASVRLGLFPVEQLCNKRAPDTDRIELFMKVWHASGYSDQDAYLQLLGIDKNFLDYEGLGEIRLVLRDFIVAGDWGNRIDLTSKVGGMRNAELQYQQKIPHVNFSIYMQHWYGYNETLLRFDRFGQRTFFGVAFVY